MQGISKSSSFAKSPRKYGDFRDKYIDIPFTLEIGAQTSYRYFADYHYLKADSKDDRKTLNETVLTNANGYIAIR